MDFDLTEEQRLLQDTVRRFLVRECPRDYVRALDRSGDFAHAPWQGLADLGCLQLGVAREFGGAGGSLLDAVVVIEALAQSAVALAVPYINSGYLAAKLICGLGTETQRAELLPRLMRGDLKSAFAWTEPAGGTDVLAMTTTAEADADRHAYRVNGTKVFITQAHVADVIYTVARTSKAQAKRSAGLSCLMIPRDLPGMHIRPIEKLGQRATGFCEVRLEDVLVPRACLLGAEGQAWQQMLPLLAGERACFAAVCLGIAQAAFDDALRYTRERSAFGKTLSHFQILQHYIAEMKTLIDASRLLTYRAAWLDTRGLPVAVEATQALMHAAETVSRVTDLGMQILGGYGYTTEFDMERHWRDGRVFKLSPITTEVAKNVIAQSLGMPRSY